MVHRSISRWATDHLEHYIFGLEKLYLGDYLLFPLNRHKPSERCGVWREDLFLVIVRKYAENWVTRCVDLFFFFWGGDHRMLLNCSLVTLWEMGLAKFSTLIWATVRKRLVITGNRFKIKYRSIYCQIILNAFSCIWNFIWLCRTSRYTA